MGLILAQLRMNIHNRTEAGLYMTHVQLIEKVRLPNQVWLTFWDLDERVQLSMEIGSPENAYQIGEVFRLNRDAKFEKLALSPIDAAEVANAKLLIPLPSNAPRRAARQRFLSADVVASKGWRFRGGGRSSASKKSSAASARPDLSVRESVSLLVID
jgi:hypothetical protein